MPAAFTRHHDRYYKSTPHTTMAAQVTSEQTRACRADRRKRLCSAHAARHAHEYRPGL
jgi:hypothetical protein